MSQTNTIHFPPAAAPAPPVKPGRKSKASKPSNSGPSAASECTLQRAADALRDVELVREKLRGLVNSAGEDTEAREREARMNSRFLPGGLASSGDRELRARAAAGRQGDAPEVVSTLKEREVVGISGREVRSLPRPRPPLQKPIAPGKEAVSSKCQDPCDAETREASTYSFKMCLPRYVRSEPWAGGRV